MVLVCADLCRVTVDGKIKFACVDGPDFDGLNVDFDELMARQRMFKEEEHLVDSNADRMCNLMKGLNNMPNMSNVKVEMPSQEPEIRATNFKEVALGYTKEMAQEEAARCLNCKKPRCVDGCPVNVPIPHFIQEVVNGDFEKAYEIITTENALPAICGRVCPQENQCEGKCIRGIKGESVAIGRLERFVADYHRDHGKPTETKIEKNGKKVAIVGSGPSGISCAGELAKRGYDVTVFEALHKTGGVLSYGIPEFRLPKDLVQAEIDGVADLGVKFETNVVVGRSITIDELQESGYDAVFVGAGAGLPRFRVFQVKTWMVFMLQTNS